jgi:hypothetical protein
MHIGSAYLCHEQKFGLQTACNREEGGPGL